MHQVDRLPGGFFEIAAALAKQAQGNAPFLLPSKPMQPARELERDSRGEQGDSRPRNKPRRDPKDRDNQPPEEGMDRFRIEVGHNHKVKPGNIVGAIANEADIDSKFIGRINIFDDYSLVDLPENMPRELMNALKPVRVAGQRLNISLLGSKTRKDKQKDDKPKRAKPKVRQQKKKDKGKPKRARKTP